MKEINIKILKRNLQLHKLGIGELDSDEDKLCVFLLNNLSKLKTHKSDMSPNDLYYGKSADEIVLYYEVRKKCLWVEYSEVWSFFSKDLQMEKGDIDLVMLWWVGYTLGLKPKLIDKITWF